MPSEPHPCCSAHLHPPSALVPARLEASSLKHLDLSFLLSSTQGLSPAPEELAGAQPQQLTNHKRRGVNTSGGNLQSVWRRVSGQKLPSPWSLGGQGEVS